MHVASSSRALSVSDRYKSLLDTTSKYHSLLKQLSVNTQDKLIQRKTINMKCFVAVLVFALVAVALADSKPTEVESIEPVKTEAAVAPEAARDKRGLLYGAAYTAPVAYSAYTAPVAYSAPYTYPYAYSAYSSYPYYAAAYSSPYYLA